jgi:hypothetical protein
LLRREITEHGTLLDIVPAHEVSSLGILEMDYTSLRITKQEENATFSSAC